MTTFPSAAKLSVFLISLVALSACSSKSDSKADSTAIAPATAVDTSTPSGTGNMQMSGMANMTGDPDRDFLRMMSDHHKGLIAMVHPTLDKKENLAVKGDASKMDKKQDAEIEKMITMLDQQYKDAYTPSVMPDNQRMVDELNGKSGADYSRTFLKNVIAHHQQAVKMIDDYLPKAKNPQVKSMAEKMKSDQTKEIAELQKKLSVM
ncbi:MAG TPA: DUF305 domain-containing protein [Gemmatimonadaceae bacterium]|nr:DUF305 domain-containing protein [Gemmatimonadaceae bacterium]